MADKQWDASNNLTSTTVDGVVTIYAYDAGGAVGPGIGLAVPHRRR